MPPAINLDTRLFSLKTYRREAFSNKSGLHFWIGWIGKTSGILKYVFQILIERRACLEKPVDKKVLEQFARYA
jgi:hypothetical protein